MILGITLAIIVILVTIIPVSIVLSRKARAKGTELLFYIEESA